MKRSSHLRPILVVDDDIDALSLTEALLKRAKVANPVITARSADEAKALLRKACPAAGGRRSEKPILVLLDVNMPGPSGFDVLQWIRRRKTFDRTGVVMWSTSVDPTDRKRATAPKADAFLDKFPSALLLGAIVRANQARARQSASRLTRPLDGVRMAARVEVTAGVATPPTLRRSPTVVPSANERKK
jgi:CheY-like chemotaxis protein